MKFAIIVPYRDRLSHLNKFKSYMTRFKDADIFVIEQAEGKPFNRGKLLNIGVIENDYEYYALHDVDMLPVKSDYSYPEFPTLLATKVQQFGYKMPAPDYFGGVVLISRKDMIICNGYHNEFWGWGGEDCSFRLRVLETIKTINYRECIFNSLTHPRKIDPTLHTKNVSLLKSGCHLDNGISNCEYKIIKKKSNHIIVDI